MELKRQSFSDLFIPNSSYKIITLISDSSDEEWDSYSSISSSTTSFNFVEKLNENLNINLLSSYTSTRSQNTPKFTKNRNYLNRLRSYLIQKWSIYSNNQLDIDDLSSGGEDFLKVDLTKSLNFDPKLQFSGNEKFQPKLKKFNLNENDAVEVFDIKTSNEKINDSSSFQANGKDSKPKGTQLIDSTRFKNSNLLMRVLKFNLKNPNGTKLKTLFSKAKRLKYAI